MRLNVLLPLLASITACTAADDAPECTGGKCDADQTCDDLQYGDGTCQPQLSCGVPDIDCFETFDTDAAAATWFTEFEQELAAGEQRQPRTLVAETDPRFSKARELLDRGWEVFRKHRSVGQLADKRPALVLINDPENNAFVVGDPKTDLSVFSVQVQTGLLDANAPDDANLGVMMHELQHAVGLHLISDTRERTRKFYIAPQNLPEPIGRGEASDMRATTAGVAWRAASEDAGMFSAAELGGFPFKGQTETIFTLVAASANQQNPTGCAHALELANSLRNDLYASVDRLDTSLTIDLATVPARVDAAMTALETECMANFTKSFYDVVAFIAGSTPQEIEASMSQHDRDLVAGKHIIDAISAILVDRRATMRAAEATFTEQTGRPWSALRYFSIEEDADDISIAVLRGAKLDPAGQATFLLTAIPNERARCEQILASGDVPPYGVDYSDEHHATCWRVFHIRQAADSATGARVAPTAPLHVPARLPLPRPLSDRIAY